MNKLNEFIDAVVRVGNPPCESCNLRMYCSTHRMACRNFSKWANTGKTYPGDDPFHQVPSRRIYSRLLGAE